MTTVWTSAVFYGADASTCAGGGVVYRMCVTVTGDPPLGDATKKQKKQNTLKNKTIFQYINSVAGNLRVRMQKVGAQPCIHCTDGILNGLSWIG